MLELVPITDTIGTEVRGIDVTKNISDRDFERIYQAWIDTTILLFRGQDMTPAQHVDFTKRFGEIFTLHAFSVQRLRTSGNPHPVEHHPRRQADWLGLQRPCLAQRRALPDGTSDRLDALRARGAARRRRHLVRQHVRPYEALPKAVKERIDDLKVVISRVQSRPYNYPDRPAPTAQERAEWIDVTHPLVRVHEVNGRKALYAGGNVPWRIDGMPEVQSAPLVTFLQEFAIQPRFTYCHKWRVGDIVLWDNRSAMHRATYYDHVAHRRLMHRTTICGEPSVPYPAAS